MVNLIVIDVEDGNVYYGYFFIIVKLIFILIFIFDVFLRVFLLYIVCCLEMEKWSFY